jgi:hypothetical protein
MDIKDLAKAMEDTRLRGSMMEELSSSQANAFEEYINEYQANETLLNKKDD